MQRPIDLVQFPDTPLTNAATNWRERFAGRARIFVTRGIFDSGIAQAVENVSEVSRTPIDKSSLVAIMR